MQLNITYKVMDCKEKLFEFKYSVLLILKMQQRDLKCLYIAKGIKYELREKFISRCMQSCLKAYYFGGKCISQSWFSYILEKKTTPTCTVSPLVVSADELHQKTGCRDPVRGGPERPHPGTDPPQEAVRGVPAPHQESESRGAGIQIVQHDSTVHQGTVVVSSLIMGNLKKIKNC